MSTKEKIEQILKRPHMYASSPESLEEQVMLLLFSDEIDGDLFREKYNKFIAAKFGRSISPLSVYLKEKAIDTMAEFLREFTTKYMPPVG